MRLQSLPRVLPVPRAISSARRPEKRGLPALRKALGALFVVALVGPGASLPGLGGRAEAQVTTNFLTSPKKTTRYWMNAVAPDGAGGWNFITQYDNFGSSDHGEYVVVKLGSTTGALQDLVTPVGTFTSSNFVDYTVGLTPCDQSVVAFNRASNGRIFWGEAQDVCRIGYYDPTDQNVHELSAYTTPPTGTVDTVFSMAQTHGSSGKLYAGTLTTGDSTSGSAHFSKLIEIDPTTNPPTQRVVASMGVSGDSYERYAYYVAVDPRPSTGASQGWAYVCYGKIPWRLYAINIATGATNTLAQNDASGVITNLSFNMNNSTVTQGITCTVSRGSSNTIIWCLDGAGFTSTYPSPTFPSGQTARDCTPAQYLLTNPPEVDVSTLWPSDTGAAAVSYKLFGQSTFSSTNFSLTQPTSPINIESLITLPDGKLFGNGSQYAGYFTYTPTSTTGGTTVGTPGMGPSTGPRIALNSRVYLSGYPNGPLFKYDWTAAWAPSGTIGAGNPALMGDWFTNTHVKRMQLFADGGNNRLYAFGDQERDFTHVGLGYTDLTSGGFPGTMGGVLDTMTHARGLAVVSPAGTKLVVVSTYDANNILVYNADLTTLLHNYTLPAPLDTTVSGGVLFPGPNGEVLGVTLGKIYRMNVTTGAITTWVPFQINGADVQCTVTTVKSDGTIWGIANNGSIGYLVCIDPTTLGIKNYGQITGYSPTGASSANLTWGADPTNAALFYSFGADLFKLTYTTPPTVSVTSPANNSSYSMGSNITINATATAGTGTVNKVEFFRDTIKVGESTVTPYTSTWYFASTGTHPLTAKASNSVGASTASAPVNVILGASPGVHIFAECESGVLGTPMASASDATASNGQYVASNLAESGYDTMTFNAAYAGNYAVWVHVKAPASGTDTFYVSSDGGSEDICDVMYPSSSWQWVRVNGRGGTGTPNTISTRVFNWTTTGNHTVKIRNRDANVKFDRVMVTTDPDEIPVG